MNRLDAYGRIQNAAYIPTYTWAQLPISASRGSFAYIDGDTWGPFSVNGLLLQYRDDLDSTQPWVPVGSGIWYSTNAFGNIGTNAWTDMATVSLPAKITLRCRIMGGTNAYDSSLLIGCGTTSASGNIVQNSANVNDVIPDTTASADTTFAASSTLYLSWRPFDGTYYVKMATWMIQIKKMAGQA